jgi:hypothetical protein
MPDTETPTKIKTTARQKAQTTAPWVALAAAIAVPFFSYLEARDTARAARDKVNNVQQSATKIDKQTDTTFKLVMFELRRLGKDVEACHAKYADLQKNIDERRASHLRRIKRPPPQKALPKSYHDVKSPPDGGQKP